MKPRSWWKNPLVLILTALCLTVTGIAAFSVFAIARALTPHRTDRALSPTETTIIDAAITLMRERGLTPESLLAAQVKRQGLWRAATPADGYLKGAEQVGDTPFAYTLASGHHPTAIVLAPRFFSDASPAARAALMIHEMGHYKAYIQAGRSDEFDGYKAEYDTHTKLGLSEIDGLTYFSMLDGVVEYVVPHLPIYQSYPDVKAYMTQTRDGSA